MWHETVILVKIQADWLAHVMACSLPVAHTQILLCMLRSTDT
jgi:hypothetical protein